MGDTDSIIVTVTDKNKSFFCDIEIPVDLEVSKLKDDMVETLNEYNPELFLNSAASELICARMNKKLDPNKTLKEIGVWNGDYITITEE